MSKKEQTFEQTLQEATAIIEELEKGELSLEELIKEHKKGRTLINECFEMLQKAEEEFVQVTTELNESMKIEEQ